MIDTKMKQYNIMLVDDDFSTSRFHQIVLERLPSTKDIIFSRNGKEALDYLLQQGDFEGKANEFIQPDLILIDLNMPVMNGFRFIELYTETTSFKKKQPKIVVLSTTLIPEEKEKIEKNENISKFLNKPLTKEMVSNLMTTIW
jgi:CheY-like chemotaxis protein